MPWHPNTTIKDHHHGKYKEYIGSSDIKNFIRSPKHCRYAKDHPKEPTPTLEFGTIFHSVALEPDTVVVAPELNMRKKADKAEMEVFKAANADKVIATPAQYEQAKNMVDAIMNHRIARSLMEAPGEIEITGTFLEPTLDIQSKIRVDKLNREDHIMIDLKSTVDASEEAFEKDIYKFGYDVSGCWYNLGGHQIDHIKYDFILIAAEKEPPHGVNTVTLTEDKHFKIAYREIDGILHSLHQCIKKDHWPCYPQKLISPDVPAWKYKRYHA